ncbi:MAG: sigma-70 family RNA polymerase sigma factor [Putridiphycobacter sp.]|nr:sigma-70 family RNA polymerase sigma factor [Putridiphycobacter sp.]
MKQKRQAQEALFNRFAYMVKGVCMRYSSSEEEADDFLQDTFLKTFQKLDQYSNVGALGGWIRRIAVNTALEHIRKQKMINVKLSVEMESVLPDDAGDHLFEKMDVDVLTAKIQSLPPGYRTVFNLFAVEGYSHKEIAEKMKISEGTSKSQFSRARKMLVALIQKDELETEKKLRYVD